ncbi:hypothetical protein AVEN_275529-1 [Araneus ventricosus]|uniref:Uncharacterized protein n=1 Tax=Araneus ventricosus TaxID=182803 RepID=A0A4Y2XBH4_ARAVE|nr:hypothetical protein AVEN_275529-1 [Araneus ventricosus]
MYEDAGRMEPSTLNLGDKLSDHFGDKFNDEMWDLKSTGIFIISIRGPRPGFIQIFHVTSRPVGETIRGPCSDYKAIVYIDRLGTPLVCESLWNLSLEFYPLCELLDAKRY